MNQSFSPIANSDDTIIISIYDIKLHFLVDKILIIDDIILSLTNCIAVDQ